MNQEQFSNYIKEIKQLLKEKHPLLDGKIVYFPFCSSISIPSEYNERIRGLNLKEESFKTFNSADDEGFANLNDLNYYGFITLKQNLERIIKDLKEDSSESIEEQLIYEGIYYCFIKDYEITFDVNKDSNNE